MPNIILSYRRAHSDAIAGRIRDKLVAPKQCRCKTTFYWPAGKAANFTINFSVLPAITCVQLYTSFAARHCMAGRIVCASLVVDVDDQRVALGTHGDDVASLDPFAVKTTFAD